MVLTTVFTPTYNRGHCIHRCYESLCRQTSYNFRWLIVDDGSVDNTKEIVDDWIKTETRFQITYIKKENGGLHTAYNKALENVETLLFTCLESDDYFTDDAIAIIENMWETKVKGKYVGFIALCVDENGNLVGDEYPDDIEATFYYNHRTKATGDKQYVFKTDVLKRVFPQKTFKNEKYFDPKYSFFKIDRIGKFAVTNKRIVVTEYQEGGLTKTMFKQYYQSPNSFAEYRKLYMTLPDVTPAYIYRQNIHYVAECIIAKKYREALQHSPKPFYTVAAYIPGAMLALYIRFVNRGETA